MTAAAKEDHSTDIRQHLGSLRALWVGWGASRVVMILTLGIPLEVATTVDVVHYHDIARSIGEGGAEAVRVWEYPIGSLLVALAVDALPGSLDRDYLVAFIAVAIGADFLLTSALLRSTTSSKANHRGAWLWIVASLALGPITLTRLDVYACAATALALAAIAARREATGGFILWVGGALKVWPAFVAVSLLAGSARRGVHILTGAATATFLVTTSLFLGWSSLLLDFIGYQGKRGIETESAWALPLLWARILGSDNTTSYQFGAMQVDGPGASALALVASASLPVAVVAAIVFTHRKLGDWSAFERVTTAGVLSVAATLLTNKVFSTQYILWLVVVVAASMGHSRLRLLGPAVLLVLAAVVSHAIFPWSFAALVEGKLFAVVLASARVAFVAAAAYLVVRQVSRVQTSTPSSQVERGD